jgi:hypothetical protein
MPPKAPAHSVTIVGGGIAGLTAALRLAERGFAVTIFEQYPLIGGNLSAVKRKETYHEVYPHMFGQWYHNFWSLVHDIGLSRERDFERRNQVGFLRLGEFPNYKVMTNLGATDTAIKNIMTGIGSLPELFIINYTILDLIARGDNEAQYLERQTLNDFIVNRPYATQSTARFFSESIDNIWSIDSDLTSAVAYQRFAKYAFKEPSPSAWVLKGNSYERLIVPLRKKLEALKCVIVDSAEVRGVRVRGGRIAEICYDEITYGEEGVELKRTQHREPHAVENLIIAASPGGLSDMIFSKSASRPGANAGDRSIVSVLPELANVRRLGSAPLPVLYVAFTRALADIPSYYVALTDSKYALTFVKVEELSTPEKTVLALAASDFDSIPIKLAGERARKDHAARDVSARAKTSYWSELSKHSAVHDAARVLLTEFNRYVPINLDEDVDWDNTFFQPNLHQKLFVNQVGSEAWCTKTTYAEIPNLYFAGDTTLNPVTMATVESAVYSGCLAAHTLAAQQQHAHTGRQSAVPVITPESYPTSLMFAAKVMLAPYAALAKLWVEADAFRKEAAGGPMPALQAGARAASEWARGADGLFADWWRTTESLARLFTGKRS